MPTINKINLNGVSYDVGGGLTEEVKQGLLNFAEKAAYSGEDYGDQVYDELYDAFYPPIPATSVTLSSNSLSFSTLGTTRTLTATVLPSDTTDTLSWSSSDTSVATVSNGVVTSVGYGSAVITATAGSVSATCSVVIAAATLVSISAVYTQGGEVYPTDSLDSLKADLVVTATFSDSSTEIVPSTDYTLTGTLTVGTSVITVSYAGKTTTFNVTVSSENWTYTPSMGLLSEQSFVSDVIKTSAAENIFVESIEDGKLKLYLPMNSAWPNVTFLFAPTGKESETITIKFMLTDCGALSSSNTGDRGYFDVYLYSGSGNSGASFGIARYGGANPFGRYLNGSNYAYNTGYGQIAFNTWHTAVISIANGTQTITVDGTSFVAGNANGTKNVGGNSLYVRASNAKDTTIYIESIEYTVG